MRTKLDLSTLMREISSNNNYLDNVTRREELSDLMDELIITEKNCYSCAGHCCTYTHNSMQVTPIQALDIYQYLVKENRINDALTKKLEENIKEFRLDHELNLGRGREFRRQYTCPFFNNGPKGCSIAPESKPYGCLGFNALEKKVSEVGHCTSYKETLEDRENRCADKEDKINQILQSKLNLYWSKKNLPVAILELIKLFKK